MKCFRVADLDALIKKISTVWMDWLVISHPCMIQDVTMKRVGFFTLQAWLIRRIGSSCLTRQRALWYLSRLGQAEWSWLSEDSANISQGRTGQDRAGWAHNEERTGYFFSFTLSDILVDCIRVSACSICPINKCSFVWHNFLPLIFVFKSVINFLNFSHQIFLNSYLCSHMEGSL